MKRMKPEGSVDLDLVGAGLGLLGTHHGHRIDLNGIRVKLRLERLPWVFVE